MTNLASKFRNVILCEDIRDEVGNKKSLMGVLSGDILVPHFPATLQMAFYFEYELGPDDEREVTVNVRLLQGDDEIAKAFMKATVPAQQHANFVLPKGFVAFEKEVVFRMLVSVNDDQEQEILTKKVALLPSTS